MAKGRVILYLVARVWFEAVHRVCELARRAGRPWDRGYNALWVGLGGRGAFRLCLALGWRPGD